MYTGDLMALERSHLSGAKQPVHEELSRIVTPLILSHWETMLGSHPDRQFATYICKGLQEGFRIGFGPTTAISSARKNMFSATNNQSVVAKYLREEQERGVVLGPFPRSKFPEIHVNRFGVIPKSHQPGKWRLIVDLSHPEGRSVNDGISSDLCSLKYVKVDDVVKRVWRMGYATEMAKIDVKSAYRIVPVHPEDRHLLGMAWEGQIYVDAALPFGLRSAPKIFNALADALEWIVRWNGVQDLWHYLDDFITCGQSGSQECKVNLQLLLDVCRHLGIPLAEEKMEGPTTCLTFLGIEIDTVAGELRLPREKLNRLQVALQEWLQKRRCTKRELQSIAGQLQHAATIVRPGRTFLRRLYDLSSSVSKPDHHIKLNVSARSDLAWWCQFLSNWNGISLMASLGEFNPIFTLTSDASGKWGCGAFWDKGWFQLPWKHTNCPGDANIAEKELIPIVISAAVWGKSWQGCVVQSRCDNMAVVAILKSRTSKEHSLMHLLRCLTFFEAKFSFRIISSHIAGRDNTMADDLSRDKLASFLQVAGPQAIVGQVIPPQPLLDMLINVKPDWTSPVWTKMFRDTLSLV